MKEGGFKKFLCYIKLTSKRSFRLTRNHSTLSKGLIRNHSTPILILTIYPHFDPSRITVPFTKSDLSFLTGQHPYIIIYYIENIITVHEVSILFYNLLHILKKMIYYKYNAKFLFSTIFNFSVKLKNSLTKKIKTHFFSQMFILFFNFIFELLQKYTKMNTEIPKILPKYPQIYEINFLMTKLLCKPLLALKNEI